MTPKEIDADRRTLMPYVIRSLRDYHDIVPVNWDAIGTVYHGTDGLSVYAGGANFIRGALMSEGQRNACQQVIWEEKARALGLKAKEGAAPFVLESAPSKDDRMELRIYYRLDDLTGNSEIVNDII